MPNIAVVFKEEIARLARKEVRAETEPLKKAASHYRSTIASLKREIQALSRQLARLQKANGSASVVSEGNGEVRHRYSAARLAAHRQKLGLSAEAYGVLVGVTGQSIYKWESGKARPRRAQIDALARVRAMGKREATARLASMQ